MDDEFLRGEAARLVSAGQMTSARELYAERLIALQRKRQQIQDDPELAETDRSRLERSLATEEASVRRLLNAFDEQ